MMLHKKKYIIVVIISVTLIGILFLVYFTQSKEPADIIESKINLKLPSTSKIINFNSNRFSGDFDAKIQINANDIENIKKELLSFFKQEYIIKNIENLPQNEKYISWWDMDRNNVEVCYKTVISGEKHLLISTPKSAIVWAFIVKQSDENYYLYISCFS